MICKRLGAFKRSSHFCKCKYRTFFSISYNLSVTF